MRVLGDWEDGLCYARSSTETTISSPAVKSLHQKVEMGKPGPWIWADNCNPFGFCTGIDTVIPTILPLCVALRLGVLIFLTPPIPAFFLPWDGLVLVVVGF